MPEQNNQHVPNIKRALAIVGTMTLTLAGCWQVREGLAVDSIIPESSESVVSHINQGETLPGISVLPKTSDPTFAPTTSEQPITTTSTIEVSLPPTTTPPSQPWDERLYIEKDCSDQNSLRVIVQGEDGSVVGAQVSVDYWMGTHKVDSTGQEIPPYEGYSDFVYINPDVPPEGSAEGTRNVCFVAPYGASVYVEVYGKKFTHSEGEIGQHPQFGNAMSGQMWPGPNQTTYLNLPRECSAGGSAGSISVRPHSGGIEFTPHRLAAWDDTLNISPGLTRGFGAEDVVFTNESEIRTLNGLVPNRTYLFQAQFTDAGGASHTAVIPKLPVDPCQDELVDIDVNFEANTCSASVSNLMLECALDQRFVG